MAVTIELPGDVERRLRADLPDLDAQIKEAAALELFRQRKLSHNELSQVLGLDRLETDDFLHKHNVTEDLGTVDDVLAEVRAMEKLRASPR